MSVTDLIPPILSYQTIRYGLSRMVVCPVTLWNKVVVCPVIWGGEQRGCLYFYMVKQRGCLSCYIGSKVVVCYVT